MADWHLDKNISIGHVVTTLTVAVGAVLWMADLGSELDSVKLEQAHIKQSLIRVETQTDSKVKEITKQFKEIREEQKDDSRRIEEKIDKLIERELNGAHRR